MDCIGCIGGMIFTSLDAIGVDAELPSIESCTDGSISRPYTILSLDSRPLNIPGGLLQMAMAMDHHMDKQQIYTPDASLVKSDQAWSLRWNTGDIPHRRMATGHYDLIATFSCDKGHMTNVSCMSVCKHATTPRIVNVSWLYQLERTSVYAMPVSSQL
jgi:hypothetical protein